MSAHTVKMLITEAYYLSGIVARELQQLSGDQLIDGKRCLNQLLSLKTIDNALIPYHSTYSFSTVAAQESYFIPRLIEIETLTFFINNVRFPTRDTGRQYYFGTAKAPVQALPYYRHIEKCKGGANLFLTFTPDKVYPMILWGKFSLSEITDENEDLGLIYDEFYLMYLEYALAELICSKYNIAFQPQAAQKLSELEQLLRNVSPVDVSCTKVSTLQAKPLHINYADVNLGKGWRPA